MSRLSSVAESRPLDAYYDPIYQSPFQQNSFSSLRKPSAPHETSQVRNGNVGSVIARRVLMMRIAITFRGGRYRIESYYSSDLSAP